MCEELDEMLLLKQYRQTKMTGHGDGEWSIKDGKLVKLWISDKVDLKLELENLRRLRETAS